MFISMPSIRLAIFADRKISEVQQDFTGAFPYLKDRYPASQRIANSRLLKEAWIRRKEESEIDINDLMSVSDLENAFMDRFGLSIQVFRRSGNLWLETTMTDNWTLKQQNDHGKEISTPFRGLSNEE